jgi:hypothetical protein
LAYDIFLAVYYNDSAGRNIRGDPVLEAYQKHRAQIQVSPCTGLSHRRWSDFRLGARLFQDIYLIMAAKEKIYRRLPGRPFSPIIVSSFWSGPDHLLLVESAFFRERYRRFYYKDIQAVVMYRTGLNRVWTALWGALALLFGIVALRVDGTPFTSSTLFAICLTALVVNLILGPCCRVFLQTAVQRQRLGTLRRVRTASKVMDRIKALVEAQQGDWEKDKSIAAHKIQPGAEGVSPRVAPATVAVPQAEKAPVGPYKPLLHKILFGLLLAAGALGVIQIFLKNIPLGLLEALIHCIVLVLAIVTLARWTRHLKRTVISKINWLALILFVVYTIVGYVLYIAVLMRVPQMNYHKVFELAMANHPLALYGQIIYACGSLLLGLFGMLAVKKNAPRPES